MWRTKYSVGSWIDCPTLLKSFFETTTWGRWSSSSPGQNLLGWSKGGPVFCRRPKGGQEFFEGQWGGTKVFCAFGAILFIFQSQIGGPEFFPVGKGAGARILLCMQRGARKKRQPAVTNRRPPPGKNNSFLSPSSNVTTYYFLLRNWHYHSALEKLTLSHCDSVNFSKKVLDN